MSNLPAFKLVVPADFEYVDRSLATASWYDVYTIKAGEYPVTFVDINYRPVDTIEKAYYAKWSVDAILTEEYRVARLFQHSIADTKTPNKETQYSDHCYDYEVLRPRDGGPYAAYYIRHGEDRNWEREVAATIVPA